jgi:hypothetical protein
VIGVRVSGVARRQPVLGSIVRDSGVCFWLVGGHFHVSPV